MRAAILVLALAGVCVTSCEAVARRTRARFQHALSPRAGVVEPISAGLYDDWAKHGYLWRPAKAAVLTFGVKGSAFAAHWANHFEELADQFAGDDRVVFGKVECVSADVAPCKGLVAFNGDFDIVYFNPLDQPGSNTPPENHFFTKDVPGTARTLANVRKWVGAKLQAYEARG